MNKKSTYLLFNTKNDATRPQHPTLSLLLTTVANRKFPGNPFFIQKKRDIHKMDNGYLGHPRHHLQSD